MLVGLTPATAAQLKQLLGRDTTPPPPMRRRRKGGASASASASFSGARVFNSANQTLAGVTTPVAFNSERWDTDGYHDNATNNSRLTVPEAGYYLVGAHLLWTTTVAATQAFMWIQHSADGQLAEISRENDAGAIMHLSLNTLWQFTAGEYVEVFAGPSGAEAGSGTPMHCDFWIARLG